MSLDRKTPTQQEPTTIPYQNIDASLSPEDIKAIKDAFALIQEKLPFLINLTPEERRSLFKTGVDSVSFIENALNAAQDHPDILPATFKTEELKGDVALFGVMTDIGTIAASVASEIDDTRLAVGSEAMEKSTQIYNYVKTVAKTTPGLKPVVDQLGQRFKKAGRHKKHDDPKE